MSDPSEHKKIAAHIHTKPTKLSEFLIRFAEEPELSREFKANPLEVMTAAGLSDAEKHVVLTGDARRIASALRPSLDLKHSGAAGDNTTVVVVVVVVV